MHREDRHTTLHGELVAQPRAFFSRHATQIRTVLQIALRLSCWTVVAWAVWNHALSGFLGTGSLSPWRALAVGTLLCALSMVFEDSDTREETPRSFSA